MNRKNTSWNSVGKWYDQLVLEQGHYYHEEVIFPNLLKWSKFKKGESLLDLGCGQGVLARKLPQEIDYLGLDIAQSLIDKAKNHSTHSFLVRDITQPLNIKKKNFDYVAIILALQNIGKPEEVIKEATSHMKREGKLFIVLNHPCYRIPRQSSWGVDDTKKLQYRRVERYMTPMEVPIQMHPSKKEKSPCTYSYHHSLSDITKWLYKNDLVILRLEEWCSNKTSLGKHAKMENRSRKEFPLFLSIESSRKS